MEGDERELLAQKGGPPASSKNEIKKLQTPATLSTHADFVAPTFIRAQSDARHQKLPNCIAHRGYRAKFPENTLLAFREAIKAGAVGIETDLHLTKDGVVVISHDPSPKRCYGLKGKIIDYTWDELKELRTLAEPHVPMPRFRDVLEMFTEPEFHKNWLVLDIKLSNNDDDIMRLIASTIASVEPATNRPWSERIVLGIWAAKYLLLASKYSPELPVAHIGINLTYARHFFAVPNVGFSMLTATLFGPGGKAFIHDCQQKYNRELLAWTVNSKDRMEWCIRQGLDGLITDDPAMYQEVCKQYDETSEVSNHPMTIWTWLSLVRFWIIINVLYTFFYRMFQPNASQVLIIRKGE